MGVVDWRELIESTGEDIFILSRVNGLCKGREVGTGIVFLEDRKK